MNKNNILVEAAYGFKCTRRNKLFGIFILTIVGLIIYQFIYLFGVDKDILMNDLFYSSDERISRVLSSSIAYETAYYFNIIQLLFVVSFIASDSKVVQSRIMETLYVRPLSNGEIVIGNFLGKLLMFSIGNFISFAISILINIIFYPQSFELSAYVFYWVTLNLPALVYSLGISYLVIRFVRHQWFGMIIILVFLAIIIYWGAGWLNGLFDPFARHIPNLFSDFTGHVNLENYLLQRSFILLLGGGFLTLSVVPYPRIPNHLLTLNKCLYIAVSFFIIAGILAMVYNFRHRIIGTQREIYKQVYKDCGEFPSARVVRNELDVKELKNGDISVSSKMTLANRASIAIPLVIYLNPGLKIHSLVIDGNVVSFRRHYQAILVDKELKSGEGVEVLIHYEGNIENDICFLDTDSEKYNSGEVNSIGIYHFGYAPAFCKKEYKLLTPECIWYPVCVPPYGESGIRSVNFSRFSLKVEYDPRLIAISQGDIIEEGEGEMKFSIEHDMPGISLCIGDYKKRTIMVDSTQLALYYLPDHDYFFPKYNFTTKEFANSLASIKSDLEEEECIRAKESSINYIMKPYSGEGIFDPRQQYPYRWLTMLEVPCNFYCFPGIAQPTGEREQGGIVFIPEKMYSIRNYLLEIPKILDEKIGMMRRGNMSNKINIDKGIFMLKMWCKEIKTIIGKGSCSIRSLFRGRTTFISSLEYPLMNDVFSNIARGGFKTFTTPADDYLAVEYLNRKSLKDALYDKSLSQRELESIIRKKSEELHIYITSQTGEERFREFYLDFLANNLFKETTQEEFFRQFYQTFEFQLDSLLEIWYNVNRLAVLEIRDARAIMINTPENDEPYVIYSFKVFNRSDVPGLVATDDYQGWIIPPGEGREIRTCDRENNIDRNFFVGTPLAQNLPAILELKLEEVSSENVDTVTGVFRLDSSKFYLDENEYEIIVDNEDPGFRVVKPDSFITFLFKRKEKRKEYYTFMTKDDIWLPVIKEYFYGFPVQSALIKNTGSGKQKVEWSASLPQEGKYEVFFNNMTFSGGTEALKVKESRCYIVFDGKEEHDVIVNVSENEVGDWISLGVFDFSKMGKVTLTDRSVNGEDPHELVADAIKWVKIKE